MTEPPAAGIWILDQSGLHDARGIGGEDYHAWLARHDRERALPPAPDPIRVVEGEGFKFSYDASDDADRARIRGLVREYEGFEEWEPDVVHV